MMESPWDSGQECPKQPKAAKMAETAVLLGNWAISALTNGVFVLMIGDSALSDGEFADEDGVPVGKDGDVADEEGVPADDHGGFEGRKGITENRYCIGVRVG